MRYYMLSAIVLSGLCWAAYRLLWRSAASPRACRLFLLCALIFPLLLPLFPAPGFISTHKLPAILLREFSPGRSRLLPADNGFSLTGYAWLIYASVSFILGLMAARNLVKAVKWLEGFPPGRIGGNCIHLNTGCGPGTIGRHIFLEGAEAPDAVMQHELAHIRFGHRYDIAIAAMLKCICWINPFVWLLSKELKLAHEFEADAAASAHEPDYADHLISALFSIHVPMLSHSFSHPPIKYRIMKMKTSCWKPLRAASVLLVTAATILSAALIMQGCTKSTNSGSGKAGTVTEAASPNKSSRSAADQLPVTDQQVYKQVDVPADFGGGLNSYLVSHLKYPDAARRQGKQGKAYIAFVVSAEGHVKNANIIRSSGTPELDNEALRVVNAMPEWTPAKKGGRDVACYLTLPVAFQLD